MSAITAMGCCRKRSRIRVDHWLDQTLTSEHLIEIFSYESKTPWTCSCFLGWFTLNKGRYQHSCFFVKAGTGSTCPSMNIFPMNCVKCCPLIGFLRRLSVSIFARFIDCIRLFGNRGLCFPKEEELSSFPHSPS